MRIRKVAAGLAIAAAAVGITGGPVLAQSFFEKLFGIGSAAPRQATRPDRAGAQRMPDRFARPIPLTPSQYLASRAEPDRGPKFRTVCVRTCDGYYFPVSNATTRRNFERDARSCSASCGDQGRLFYAPDSDQPDKLVDLSGRNYTELPNAFRYRKSLISGCACKPMPWSEEALARHRQYAEVEAARKSGDRAAEFAAKPASQYKLPPPVGGPGVMIMSSIGVTITEETTPADGLAPPPAQPPPEIVMVAPPMSEPAEMTRPQVAAEPAEVWPERAPKQHKTAARARPQAQVASLHAEKPRPQRIAYAAPPRTQKRSGATSGGTMSFLGGSPKYTYPGDAPVRYR